MIYLTKYVRVGLRASFCTLLFFFGAKQLWAALPRSILRIGLGCFATGVIIFACQGKSAWGQSHETPEAIDPQHEYNVKAAFLYSFGRYIEWPKDAFDHHSGAFVLGVCGEDPFGEILDRIVQSKTIQERRIVILRMATIEELQPCHILFVSRTIPRAQQIAIFNKMRNKPTLLVGETPGSAERGCGINFFLEGNTVRFEINVEAIRQKMLILDAKLLSLGKKVPEIGAEQGKNAN